MASEKWSGFAHLLEFFFLLLVSGLTSAVQNSVLCEARGFSCGFSLCDARPEAITLLLLCLLSPSLFSQCLSGSEMELDLFN